MASDPLRLPVDFWIHEELASDLHLVLVEDEALVGGDYEQGAEGVFPPFHAGDVEENDVTRFGSSQFLAPHRPLHGRTFLLLCSPC